MSDLYPPPVPNQAWLGKKFGDLWSAVRDLQGASRRAASADDLVLVSGTLDDAVSDIAALTAQINLLSPSGFVPLVPTASTGTTVADDGLVTFNGATCDVLDLFSADYFAYWGWLDFSQSAQDGIRMRLRAGSVASTNYEHSQVSNAGGSTAVGSTSVSQDAFIADGGMSGQRHWGSLLLIDPFSVASTRLDLSMSSRRTAGPLSSTAKRGGIHTTSASYTGLRFYSAGGSATITGTGRFYGLQGLLLP